MELMEGLTVWSTGVQNGIVGKIARIVFGLIALALAIFFLVLAIYAFSDGETVVGILLISMMLCVFAIATIAFIGASEKTKTTYKVTIDRDVSFVELTERYEILNQDGSIYEIVEKGE